MNNVALNYYLKSHTIFGHLNEHEVKGLSHEIRFKTYRKGGVIDFMGKSGTHLFYLISGRGRVLEMDGEGHQIVKILLSEGELFGELSGNMQSAEYAEVLSSSALICTVPLSEIKQLMAKNPEFAYAFNQYAWERYRKAEKRIFQCVALRDTKTRLLDFISDLMQKEGIRTGNTLKIKNYFTHQELASIIGATRVTVTALLGNLKNSETISYNNGYFECVDG